jgi:lysophospholipase
MMIGLHDSPENPQPPGAVVETIRTVDGITLRTARWPALTRSPKGTICLFSGRTEYIEKYFETIADFRQRGFAVAILDWRGQGGSQRLLKNPRKGHVSSFTHYQRDVDSFIRDIVLPECPLPLFALGHSMGGAILLSTLSRRPNLFNRAVLTSPMVGLAGAAGGEIVRGAARFLSAIGIGRLAVSHTKQDVHQDDLFASNVLTRDETRFRRNQAIVQQAPDLAIGPPTIGWLNAAFQAMNTFEDADFIATIRTPLLMFAAGGDKVVNNPATARLARRLRLAQLLTVDGARHEMLMETDAVRSAFFAAFDGFIPGQDHFAQ